MSGFKGLNPVARAKRLRGFWAKVGKNFKDQRGAVMSIPTQQPLNEQRDLLRQGVKANLNRMEHADNRLMGALQDITKRRNIGDKSLDEAMYEGTFNLGGRRRRLVQQIREMRKRQGSKSVRDTLKRAGSKYNGG